MEALEQHLWDLSHQFYNQAVQNRSRVITVTHLQEYYTLVKLSIVCLQKIIRQGHRATLRLRIKAYIQWAQIIINEVNLKASDQNPEALLTSAMFLCGEIVEFTHLKLTALYTLIQLQLANGDVGRALPMTTTTAFKDYALMKFLRFQCLQLLCGNPQGLEKATAAFSSLMNCPQWSSLNEHTKKAIKLLGIVFFINNSLSVPYSVYEIDTSDEKDMDCWKKCIISTLELINNQLQYSVTLQDLQESLKEAHSDKHVLRVNLEFPHDNGVVTLSSEIQLMPLVTTQLHLIRALKSSSVKRSLDTVSNTEFACQQELHKMLAGTYSYMKSSSMVIREAQSVLQDVYFFETLLLIGNKGIWPAKFNSDGSKIIFKLDELPSWDKIGLTELDVMIKDCPRRLNMWSSRIRDTPRRAFLIAMSLHSLGKVVDAINRYMSLLKGIETHRATLRCYDIYFLSLLNLYVLLQGLLRRKIRTGAVDGIQQLLNLLGFVTQRLVQVRRVNQQFHKPQLLVTMTLDCLDALYNPGDVYTMDQRNAMVSCYQSTYIEKLKQYPLLGAMVLYTQSLTELKNSDQKQKYSQVAFNLAKLGFYPLVRYTTGLLNASNASSAHNIEQNEVQMEKLRRIQPAIKVIYNGL
ncbi:unnamed protein product [Cyberlindnera jadinii]|uniref:Cohesin loading factor n=1 Tax=Cyberlindnera jadinii (strain ATCC 18201 / CBS 1600 / BCRC 20928 / JCM 3617 / NBRC 0987 / NRRL Y-1542) TaxID=983966 RepID=A0A0H5C6S5_CYBJN|nr:unnamed protein product [Cyberlindnera jadinii]